MGGQSKRWWWKSVQPTPGDGQCGWDVERAQPEAMNEKMAFFPQWAGSGHCRLGERITDGNHTLQQKLSGSVFEEIRVVMGRAM